MRPCNRKSAREAKATALIHTKSNYKIYISSPCLSSTLLQIIFLPFNFDDIIMCNSTVQERTNSLRPTVWRFPSLEALHHTLRCRQHLQFFALTLCIFQRESIKKRETAQPSVLWHTCSIDAPACINAQFIAYCIPGLKGQTRGTQQSLARACAIRFCCRYSMMSLFFSKEMQCNAQQTCILDGFIGTRKAQLLLFKYPFAISSYKTLPCFAVDLSLM